MIDDYDNHREDRELSAEDRKLVEELDNIGAATPIQLALRLQTEPARVRPVLRKLKDNGWLSVQTRDGFETEIYFLSKKARSAIANH